MSGFRLAQLVALNVQVDVFEVVGSRPAQADAVLLQGMGQVFAVGGRIQGVRRLSETHHDREKTAEGVGFPVEQNWRGLGL